MPIRKILVTIALALYTIVLAMGLMGIGGTITFTLFVLAGILVALSVLNSS